jgi:hypothetical protein
LGYSEEDIVEMLKSGGDYTQELLVRIFQIIGVYHKPDISVARNRCVGTRGKKKL